MKLIPLNETKGELRKARTRLKRAYKRVGQYWVMLRTSPLHTDIKGLAEAVEELQGALEWFGEVYYVVKRLCYHDIEEALAYATAHRHDGLDVDFAQMDNEARIEWAIDICHDLRENSNKVTLLLAQYAEGWYSNG
jgi:predicted RNase H-like HicB family nuclease